MKLEKACFAAGCFWGVQEVFDSLKGVKKTTVGYTGGSTKNPTYGQVCSKTTGHAESVLVEFDPKEISYGKLLETFWGCHDPTTLNRQGPDVGSNYRSAIFFFGKKQGEEAKKSMQEEQKKHSGKIVTQVVPATEFYPAEEYHQKYYLKNGGASCHV
ncbi:Peptide methionine sulfoxide reductase MsrA [Candidatus Anstonella stagnisolia]|nr:Peptide methionine sulfoxide reductase MsrA [Candidatus Anstonella stagnisolia]